MKRNPDLSSERQRLAGAVISGASFVVTGVTGAISGIPPLLVGMVLVAGLAVFVVAVVRYVRLRRGGGRGE